MIKTILCLTFWTLSLLGLALLSISPLWAQSTGPVDFDVSMGLSFPKGDFNSVDPGSRSAGGARRGPCFGVDGTYGLNDVVGISAGAFVSFNDVDGRVLGLPSGLTVNTDSWRNIWLLAGPRFSGRISEGAVFEGLVEVGMLAGTSPEISFDYANQHLTQAASSSTALGYRLGIGMVYKDKGIITLQFMGGTPDYSVIAGNGTTTISGMAEQQTYLLVFTIGMRFH